MTVTLSITLGDEILKALASEKSITIALSSAPAGRAASRRARAGGKAKSPAAKRKAGYRAGSLPARLLSWAKGRKKPYGVPDVMKAMRIRRSHASMLLTYVRKRGDVRRVGRGEYAAA